MAIEDNADVAWDAGSAVRLVHDATVVFADDVQRLVERIVDIALARRLVRN